MRLLTLSLNLPLHPGDIPGFRACLAGMADLDCELFHGHNNAPGATDPYHRQYPLIQFAVRRGRATVLGLGAGAEAIRQRLLPRLEPVLTFGGRRHVPAGYQVHEQEVTIALSETTQHYGLLGWLALNGENYRQWKADDTPAARLSLLDRTLTGHLRALAEGVGLPNYKEVAGHVLEVDNQKRVRWHGTELVRFDVRMQTNLRLPEGLGLGRAAAFGFGEVQLLVQYRESYVRGRRKAERVEN